MSEKKLGLFGLLSLQLISLIGTGMFFGPAISASYAGSGAILAWIVLGIMTIYIGVLFAELASILPSAGGIYTFAQQAYGRLPSFLVGWTTWLVNTVNTSLLIIASLQSVMPTAPLAQQLVASLCLIVILHVIALKGLGASEVILDFFAFALLAFVVLTILGGGPLVNMSNFGSILPASPIIFFIALFYILETFFGWEIATFLAEETKNPTRTVPLAIMISSVIGAVLGVLMTIVLLGTVPSGSTVAGPGLLSDVFSLAYGSFGATILSLGLFLAFIGSAASNIIAGPRLLLAMARDKLFIEQFSQLHPRFGTPGKAILFQAIISTMVLWFSLQSPNTYTRLLSLMIPLALVMYVPILFAVSKLRKTNTSPRFVKAPLPFLGAILCTLMYTGTMIAWVMIDTQAIGVLAFAASLLIFGLPIYLFLSTLYNPSTQLFFSDALAYPAMAFESLIVPKHIRQKMLKLFDGLEGKTVLELGAGVGSFTFHLAEAVTPSGKVIAIEAGKNSVELLGKRLAKSSHRHVLTIHDEHNVNRLHPSISEIDAVFSLGMLGNLQDKQKVLKEIAAVMPQHAPIVFMEWIDYFGILPDPSWLKNVDALKEEFRKAGFSVTAEKVPGTFWNYLIVYGVRSDLDIPYV